MSKRQCWQVGGVGLEGFSMRGRYMLQREIQIRTTT
jgi:hypothetical protein